MHHSNLVWTHTEITLHNLMNWTLCNPQFRCCHFHWFTWSSLHYKSECLLQASLGVEGFFHTDTELSYSDCFLALCIVCIIRAHLLQNIHANIYVAVIFVSLKKKTNFHFLFNSQLPTPCHLTKLLAIPALLVTLNAAVNCSHLHKLLRLLAMSIAILSPTHFTCKPTIIVLNI
jgi:hypothetical protein